MESNKKGILQFLHEGTPVSLAETYHHQLVDFFAEAQASSGNEVLRMRFGSLLDLLLQLFPEDVHKDLAVSLTHLNHNVYCASFTWFEPGDASIESVQTEDFCLMNFVLHDRTIAWIDRPRFTYLASMKNKLTLMAMLHARGIFFEVFGDTMPVSTDLRITEILEIKPKFH